MGISGALSFLVAGSVATWLNWRWAFGVGAICTGAAFLIGDAGHADASVHARPRPRQRRLLDFRPVLRNRSAMAYALGYCVHTWEMNALRGWAVTFLAYTALHHDAGAGLLGPTIVATAMGLLGTWASVFGNELSIRFGRPRLVLTAMIGSMALAGIIGFTSAISYHVAALMVLLYGVFIWLDSSSLTAGAVGSATADARGATLAVHSTLGYAGGFVGPLMVGWILDLAGGRSVLGWGLAFAHVAVVMLVGPLALLILRPQAMAGDRGAIAGDMKPIAPSAQS